MPTFRLAPEDPAYLAALYLRGAIVSADAGNTYAKFAHQILRAGGAYLWCIKGNNAATAAICEQAFAGAAGHRRGPTQTR